MYGEAHVGISYLVGFAVEQLDEDAIINWFGVGEEISDYCHQYFKYFILLSLIQPMD